ncbi:hypothetical protein CLOM_g12402 [Closterium sp. NIES-68]|nr:hypothetical protein CLOM_g12402 [Closterium sp. NIES-68]
MKYTQAKSESESSSEEDSGESSGSEEVYEEYVDESEEVELEPESDDEGRQGYDREHRPWLAGSNHGAAETGEHGVWANAAGDYAGQNDEAAHQGPGSSPAGVASLQPQSKPSSAADKEGNRSQANQPLSTWGLDEESGMSFANKRFWDAAWAAFRDYSSDGKLCLKAYHIAWIIMVVDYGLSKVKKSTMNLSNSHRKNTRWVTSVREVVRRVVRDHFTRHNPIYCSKMRGFQWGDWGLYVHESGFEEYRGAALNPTSCRAEKAGQRRQGREGRAEEAGQRRQGREGRAEKAGQRRLGREDRAEEERRQASEGMVEEAVVNGTIRRAVQKAVRDQST